ncbi:GIY-YIG nuclease family protein [Alginatibacterium sediminis]|uniref:GIY-YIG nuclease family protein n=1 Tax=Alginatibacterium sediminis TaxID=2164068 RepID=A0A420E8L4_9ALTE|nr:GIY-YIG nuclease family protein [Alginatibacterium sediminis]RKF15741.1 GIY-YIG nuclease family protein [Alginatibacterium sediminis]
MSTQSWFVYLLQCDNALTYIGTSNDVERRFAAHQRGLGAKFTKINPPISILGVEKFVDRSSACKAESALKRRTKQQKLAWAAQNPYDSP